MAEAPSLATIRATLKSILTTTLFAAPEEKAFQLKMLAALERLDQLENALRAVVPYAESRAEDMNESAAEPHDCVEDHPDQVKDFGTCLQLAEKAWAAVENAKALLSGSEVARG